MYLVTAVALFLISIGSGLSSAQVQEIFTKVYTLDTCPIRLEPIGCFADKYEIHERAMPDHVLNARDWNMFIYKEYRNPGYLFDWNKWEGKKFNYGPFLERFLCDCAIRSFKKGYRVIGMQFFGECWGSVRGHFDYNMYGKPHPSRTCVKSNGLEGTSNFRMIECQPGDKACTGRWLSNYVYRIAPTVCDTYYEPVGCYNDYSFHKNIPQRPLPELILTERDSGHKTFSGHLIDWYNWNKYSPRMLCRCAEQALEKGFTYFGMQFFGECWSGANDKINYRRDGTSANCLAKDFKSCVYNSYHCVGKAFANRVYRLKNIPPYPNFKPWASPGTVNRTAPSTKK